MCPIPHSYERHDTFTSMAWLMYTKWLIHTRDMGHGYVCHDSFICVPWLIHMCDMTPSYVWHDSFICVTWLALPVTKQRWFLWAEHSNMWHESFICVPWLIDICDKTRITCDQTEVILVGKTLVVFQNVVGSLLIEQWQHHRLHQRLFVYTYICVRVCVCMYVCACVCVCVCVCMDMNHHLKQCFADI